MPTGKIQRSYSAATAPSLFVFLKDGSLRLQVDYQPLNSLTNANKYLLLLIKELLDKSSGGKWFTRLDLKTVCNLIKIAVGDEWKTVFHTTLAYFKYTEMPFRLTNVPASFPERIDAIFKHIKGCVTYVDDILICGGNTEAKDQDIVKKL